MAKYAYRRIGSPEGTWARPSGAPPVLLSDLLHFQLVSLLREKYVGFRPDKASRGTLITGVYAGEEGRDGRKRLFDGAPNLGLLYKGPLPVRTDIYRAFFRVLDEFHRQSKARGAEFVLIYFPARHQVVPEDWEVLRARWNLDEDDFDPDRDSRDILKHCQEAGIACIDLTPPFRERRKSHNLFIAQDSHPNEQGHALAGQEVGRRLREIIQRSRQH